MTRTRPRWTIVISALSALVLGVVGVAAAASDDGDARGTAPSTPGALSASVQAVSSAPSTAETSALAVTSSNPEVDSTPLALTILESAQGALSAAQPDAAANAHENGHGCDDIIHSADASPGPGGPVGCDVGNSGDHRQNGVSDDDEGDDAASPEDVATPAEDKTDPHANGHGCDDVNHAGGEHEPTPGGPVGCDVGNSGEHRQNGADHGPGDESSDPTSSTATAGAGHAPVGKGPKK